MTRCGCCSAGRSTGCDGIWQSPRRRWRGAMDRDTRRRDVALDRFWDAVLGQQSAEMPDEEGVEPEDAALIERVQALGPATPLFPKPERSWRELLQRPP